MFKTDVRRRENFKFFPNKTQDVYRSTLAMLVRTLIKRIGNQASDSLGDTQSMRGIQSAPSSGKMSAEVSRLEPIQEIW